MTTTYSNGGLVWHDATVTRQRREQLFGHKALVLWFTGLSGAGKSTLAHAVEEALHQRDCRTYVLDGDNIRHGLCSDLGFSLADRSENIRRIGEVAKLFVDAGTIVMAAFISPLCADRALARRLFSTNDFVEIYCEAPLEVCEGRDVKGFYQKARRGEISEFTGVSSPYEPPLNPELRIRTGSEPLKNCVDSILKYLQARDVFSVHVSAQLPLGDEL